MYNNSYKGFKRNRFSVDRRSRRNRGVSVRGLKIARIIVAVLLVALIVSTVFVSMSFFNNSSASAEERQKSVIADEEEQNSELTVLVNKNNPLDESYKPSLSKVDGFSVNTLAADSLSKLLSDARAQNLSLNISSAYISYEEQDKLYKEKYKAYRTKYGLSSVKAQAKAESVVPQAGESEAQTGLLVKFSTEEKGGLYGSAAYSWLDANCVNYGFILRYPSDKADQTSMKPDYTIFRYVGKEHAVMMRALNMCMEEYSIYLKSS